MNTHSRAFSILAQSPAGWPDIFHRTLTRPLALGIHKQIWDALPDKSKQSRRAVTSFLHWWTDRYAYHKAVAAGERRVNLDGTAAQEITAAEIEYAKLRMKQQDEGRKKKAKALTIN